MLTARARALGFPCEAQGSRDRNLPDRAATRVRPFASEHCGGWTATGTMSGHTESETVFSPRRWFLGDDGAVRPLWRSVLFFFLAVFLFLLVGQGLRAVSSGWPMEWKMLAGYSAHVCSLLLLSWLMLAAFDRRRFRTLGLWLYPASGREFLIGVGTGTILIGAVVLMMLVGGAVAYHGANPSDWGGVALYAVILFIASAGEEIVFRGYGMQRLIDSLGEPAGVLIFSALFALVHFDNDYATTISNVNTFLAGILLSFAYLKTRGLWLPIGLHWAWNFLMGQVFSLPLSGMNFLPRLLRPEVSGPDWFSGGSYGPEGSILLTVMAVVAIVWLGQTKSISPSPAVEESLE